MFKGLLIACLMTLGIAATDVAFSSEHRRSPELRPAPKAFKHDKHVRKRWGRANEPEYERDCRGCHQFRPKGDPTPDLDPQTTCSQCHEVDAIDINIPETLPEFRQNLHALRDAGRLFDHSDHLKERCDSCHSSVTGSSGSPLETGEMVMAKGWQTCMVCHDPAVSESPARSDRAMTGRFLQRINEKLKMKPPEAASRFDHRTHLPQGRAAKQADCLECHKGIDSPDPLGWGGTSIDETACAKCHISDAAGTPIPMGFHTKTLRSRTAGTFSHAQHLGERAAQKDASLRDRSCMACHVSLEDGRTYGLDSRWEGASFSACTSCHEHQGEEWKVSDGKGGTDHGDVESCAPCHTFGTGDMASTRPMASVERGKVRSYVFLSQEHPFISKGEIVEDASKSCQPCHRAEGGGGLPSRLRGRSFNHDTHLPAAPTDADCNACHTTVKDSLSATDLVTIETKNCETCHRGEPVQLEFADPREAKRVVAFPHHAHLSQAARDAGVAGCVSCHVAAQNGIATVGTLETALNCTVCHDHGQAPQITGGKDRVYVASCRKCHGDEGLADGAEVTDQRLVVGSFGGGQFHPDPETQSCSTCHRTLELQFETRKEPHVWAELSYGLDRFHGVTRPKGGPEDCFGCHWVGLVENRPLQGFSGNYKLAPVLGNQLSSYPGRPR